MQTFPPPVLHRNWYKSSKKALKEHAIKTPLLFHDLGDNSVTGWSFGSFSVCAISCPLFLVQDNEWRSRNQETEQWYLRFRGRIYRFKQNENRWNDLLKVLTQKEAVDFVHKEQQWWFIAKTVLIGKPPYFRSSERILPRWGRFRKAPSKRPGNILRKDCLWRWWRRSFKTNWKKGKTGSRTSFPKKQWMQKIQFLKLCKSTSSLLLNHRESWGTNS